MVRWLAPTVHLSLSLVFSKLTHPTDPYTLSLHDALPIFDKVGRRHRVRLRAGERHSIHSGLIQHDDLIGRPEGIVVTTQLGARLLAVRPTFAEQVTGRRRQTQPIYPKDLGAILIAADLYPGAHVLE